MLLIFSGEFVKMERTSNMHWFINTSEDTGKVEISSTPKMWMECGRVYYATENER